MNDAAQASSGVFVEVPGEIGDHQEPVRLGQLAGLLVVLLDRLELVAEVLLDDVLHVLREVFQLLLDLDDLGPDAASDERLQIITGVHEPREALAQAHGIENREADLARRQRRKEPHDHRTQQVDGLLSSFARVLQQHGAAVGQFQQGRYDRGFRRVGHRLGPSRHGAGQVPQIQLDCPKPRAGTGLLRGFPRFILQMAPVTGGSSIEVVCVPKQPVNRSQTLVPAVLEGFAGGAIPALARRRFLVVSLPDLGQLLPGPAFDLGELLLVLLLGLADCLVSTIPQVLQGFPSLVLSLMQRGIALLRDARLGRHQRGVRFVELGLRLRDGRLPLLLGLLQCECELLLQGRASTRQCFLEFTVHASHPAPRAPPQSAPAEADQHGHKNQDGRTGQHDRRQAGDIEKVQSRQQHRSRT